LRGPGRWYGNCRDGRADGRGYGVIVDGSGNSLEYLGEAQDGLASGIGGAIRQRRGVAGATYYEGRFAKGLPDGVVQVEEPGRRPAVREFRGGDVVGSVGENRLQRLTF
jgi:hypothetical protein